MPGTNLLSDCLGLQMFSEMCWLIFCRCPFQRSVDCTTYRETMFPPCCGGLWQCLSTLNEAGPQQDLDTGEACPSSAVAVLCVQ